ncbi:hypothetical protein E4U42_000510 [Claviceps africana]|uniref:Uncharacterized protein n=1 Tax=Claviceps africana TaxID=83212 RepID=A0A8K0JG57_9HYPO|nr:hypothetical protein E4U42_000510 [Claviceps africana]
MGLVRNISWARAASGALGLIAIIGTYCLAASQGGVITLVRTNLSTRSISSPISNLEVSLKQTCASPPAIRAIVTNNNSFPVTVVTYDSPLDNLALKLGLLSITLEGSSSPLPLPIVGARRIWPPPPESLVTIAAGESAATDIDMGGPKFGVELFESSSRASVTLVGNWHAVWPKDKSSLENFNLGSASPDPDVYSGPFASETLAISIG